MNIDQICETVKKGPPRWFRMLAIALIILTVGVQLGLWQERSKNTAAAINAQFAEKDGEIDRLKIALNNTEFDLQVERKKLSIILCESSAKHDGVWGDGGRSYGICQFQYRTFDWMRKEAGHPDLRWKRRADQLWLLDWALRNGYGKYWTCYGNAHRAEGIAQSAKNNGDGR